MNLAVELAKRSTCKRRQVGCVITSDDFQHIYGVGYNGNAPGEPNDCEAADKPGQCGCEHAESNALLKVAEPSTTPKYLFVTLSPCRSCAKKMLIKKGIKKVFYLQSYRDQSSLEMLKKHQIEVAELTID